MLRRSSRIALGVGASVLFILFAIRGIDWGAAIASLTSASYAYAIPIVIVTWWQLLIRAQRWRVVLHPFGGAPMRELIGATNIGWMANYLLPLRAGEIIRPVLLSRRTGLPMGGVIATSALERIFDLVSILLLFGLVMLVVPVSDDLRYWGGALLAFAASLLAIVAVLRWQAVSARALIARLIRQLPESLATPILDFFDGFIVALNILDSPAMLLRLLAWSLYLWLALSCMFGLGFLMFGMQVPLVTGQILVTVVTAVAVAAPSAPGFIGSFQLGCRIALVELLGIAESDAFAYSVAVHVLQYVAVLSAGAYSLMSQGLRFREVKRQAESDSHSPSAPG